MALFGLIDEHNTGIIRVEAFKDRLDDPAIEAYFASLDIEAADAWTLFEMMDTEGTGDIDVDDFIKGCLRLKGNAKSIDMAQLMTDNKWMISALKEIQASLGPTTRGTTTRGRSKAKQTSLDADKSQWCKSSLYARGNFRSSQ